MLLNLCSPFFSNFAFFSFNKKTTFVVIALTFVCYFSIRYWIIFGLIWTACFGEVQNSKMRIQNGCCSKLIA